MSAVEAVGGKPASQKCPRCGKKTVLGALATHKCPDLPSKKQRYIKVKSHFQAKLSDESGGWY